MSSPYWKERETCATIIASETVEARPYLREVPKFSFGRGRELAVGWEGRYTPPIRVEKHISQGFIPR